MGKGGKVRGHLVDSSRMAGLGSRRRVNGLGEVSRSWWQRAAQSVVDERAKLQRGTEEQIVTYRLVCVFLADTCWDVVHLCANGEH